MTLITIDAHAVFDLFARQGELIERQGTLIRRAMERETAQPVYTNLAQSGTAAAGADLVIGLGGPTQGQLWELRTLTVGGVTWATAAAGTALLVRAGTRPTSAATVGLAAVLDEAASLPLPSGYASGQMVVRNPEKLYVIVQGGTAGQQYVAGYSIVEFQEAARVQTVGQ